ncbi:MBL fold metallo-hydrolase [Marinifilum caeruleilacunae]|uniref:MBL fold metallo-hydrolase n=1 Tax=Marinifilum caeruleilacunae TaxID=2499076 RepID=A0ABX1WYP2_9BACT|nr:MBL fold metallo-hydrolase [Marinifilum caeruleilacunae]NOU61157.1 MBL fold metallo-hydrolase [Marinifilum caeruleilacunae]
MKIKVLVDNTATDGFESVHGFSLIVEADEKILFDFGPNSLFLENANRLGEDFSDIKTLVLSHGHWDHGDGLEHIRGKKLILHPNCFARRYRKRNRTNVGLSKSKEELSELFDLQESSKPLWISKQIVFLGEIPRRNDFESKVSPFLLPDNSPDFVPDDSAIAITTNKGLVVISGCAHAGICNTINYAKEISNCDEIFAVIGGFHLKEIDEITLKTIAYMQAEKVKILGPTHCTSFKVREEFARYFNVMELAAGAVIEL